MAEFLVELYVARSGGRMIPQVVSSAKLAAETLTREGKPVRCISAVFVPEDETCFFLYEAATADLVREAGVRADLQFDRIALALASRETDGRQRSPWPLEPTEPPKR